MVAPEQLADFALLADVTEAQLRAVAALTRGVDFPVGAAIIEEGRAATGCWLLRSGQVALEISAPNGAAHVVQTLGAGDVLGWSWLIAPYRWRFDARATTPVAAYELDTEQLRAVIADDPVLGYALSVRLVEALADRLQATRARLVDLYGSARAR